MSVKEKISNAKPTKWITEGIPEEEEKKIVKSAKEYAKAFNEGYDKAINDIMHIVDEADDCANAMYSLGQFVMERKMKQ